MMAISVKNPRMYPSYDSYEFPKNNNLIILRVNFKPDE